MKAFGARAHLFEVTPAEAQSWLDRAWPVQCHDEKCERVSEVLLLIDGLHEVGSISGLGACSDHSAFIDEYVERAGGGIAAVDVCQLPINDEGGSDA